MTGFDVDGILFDLGSTLLEYETIPWSILDVNCIDSAHKFLEKGGYNIPPIDQFWSKHREIWNQYRCDAAETLKEWRINDAITDLLNTFDISGNGKLTDQFFEAFYAPISRQLSIFGDTHTVLQRLKSGGKRIGLVSNTYFPEKYHLDELRRFNLLDLFDFTIFSVSFGYRKPHQSIYTRAAELLEIEPARILFVGDRFVEDCLGPQEAGMKAAVKFRPGREYPDSMRESQVVVGALTDLLNYISV